MVKHDMSAPKMTRVTVRVPKTTLDQINDWVDTLGVRRSHFLGIALVAGVRSLIQASALELSLDRDENAQSEGKKHAPRLDPAEEVAADLEAMDREALIGTVQALQAKLSRLQAEREKHQEQPRLPASTRTMESATTQHAPGRKRSSERAAV